jgi:hypothetical protein
MSVSYSGDEGFARTVADIVRFLISYNPNSDRFRDQAGIKKAHFFFVVTKGFGVDQSFSWRRFSTIWGEFKGVAAFIYVNEYHFKRQLEFDPASADFFDRIEQLLRDQAGLLRFFRQNICGVCEWQRWRAVSLNSMIFSFRSTIYRK